MGALLSPEDGGTSKPASKKFSVVREVRRWQERELLDSQKLEQYRELVLFLVHSDDYVLEPHSLDFAGALTGGLAHLKDPDESTSMVDSQWTVKPHIREGPDNVHSQLDR